MNYIGCGCINSTVMLPINAYENVTSPVASIRYDIEVRGTYVSLADPFFSSAFI